jgi:hypothetical protein
MQQMKQSSTKQKNHVDSDELIALNAWHRIDRQTREAIKRNFLPDLLDIYEVCLSFSLIVLFKPIAILFVFLFATMVTRFV